LFGHLSKSATILQFHCIAGSYFAASVVYPSFIFWWQHLCLLHWHSLEAVNFTPYRKAMKKALS